MFFAFLFKSIIDGKSNPKNAPKQEEMEKLMVQVPSKPMKPKGHIDIEIQQDASENTRFCDLGLDFERFFVFLANKPEVDIQKIQEEPISKYTIEGKLLLARKRKPIRITFSKNGNILSESLQMPQKLIGQCISQYTQLYNVVIKEGKYKDKELDKPTHNISISNFTTSSLLSLLLTQKKMLISSNPTEKVFIADKVITSKDRIKINSTYQVEKTTGQKIQKKLEEDVPNLMKNVVDLIQTQTSTDALKIVLESYERSIETIDQVASKKVQQSLKSKKTNHTDHHPAYILGQALKKQKGVEVTYSEGETAASVFSMLHLSTMFGDNYGKALYKLNEDEYTFDQLTADELKRSQFIISFKKQMAEYYNTTEDKIIVEQITRGSINVKFYYEQGNPEYSKKADKHLKGKLLKEEKLFNYLNLSACHFDKRGDINFIEQYEAEQQKRGRLPYYQPSGWVRYGLNVQKWMKDGDKNWLKMDGCDEEWAVMYHGVTRYLKSSVKSIADSTLKPGGAQVFAKSTPLIPKGILQVLEAKAKRQGKTLKKVVDDYLGESKLTYVGVNGQNQTNQFTKDQVGKGVYGSPLIQVCASGYCAQTVKFDDDPGSEYQVVFQCRVRPESIRICEGSNTYWVIRNPEDIRPYGLLISKRKTNGQKKHQSKYEMFSKSYQKFLDQKVDLSKIE